MVACLCTVVWLDHGMSVVVVEIVACLVVEIARLSFSVGEGGGGGMRRCMCWCIHRQYMMMQMLRPARLNMCVLFCVCV